MSLRNSGMWQRLHEWLPNEFKDGYASPYLSGNAEGQKTVIRFFKAGDSVPSLVLKGSRGEGQAAIESESQILGFLQSRSTREGGLGFSAPTPLRSFEQGGWYYTMETAAPGHPLSELIFLRSRRRRMEILRHELSRCAQIAETIPHVLDGAITAHRIDPSWYEIPLGVNLDAPTKAEVRLASSRCEQAGLCAHGDFTIENVFWESATEEVSVIDWELPMRGVPQLYDVYTLLLSSLPALALEIPEITNSDNRLESQFRAAFFGTGPWAMATREILERTSAASDNPWLELLMFLVIRSNYFLWRQPALGREYSRLLQFAAEHKKSFVGPVLASTGFAQSSRV